MITISGIYGSGGRTVGKMLAQELGYAFYDREIMQKIAEETGSSTRHVEAHEVKRRDVLTGMLMNLFDNRNFPDTVYLRSLIRLFKKIEKEGRAVVIGRGGFVAIPTSIKLRFIAPLDVRIERVALLEHITKSEARARILENDARQESFLQSYFNTDSSDPLAFDLIVNTEALSLEHILDLALTRVRDVIPEE